MENTNQFSLTRLDWEDFGQKRNTTAPIKWVRVGQVIHHGERAFYLLMPTQYDLELPDDQELENVFRLSKIKISRSIRVAVFCFQQAVTFRLDNGITLTDSFFESHTVNHRYSTTVIGD